ncbi:hypothetical protein DDE82_008707 [Stemphylium lycopersici]|nr:hypothetical protein DDE82_008707 [Stemphylium lycopersici]
MTCLDTLPPEILFQILSYTEPICSMNLKSYPLNALAETNKQLNAIVEEREFAKMTMTQASQQTHLSKLDLFTPSPLHPSLPPLATGAYPVMGSVATMLSTADVLERNSYIRSLLGDKAHDEAYMRVRPATHERIIKHLNIEYHEGVGWVESKDLGDEDESEEKGEGGRKGPKSMWTREGRRRYVEKGLKREREALGMQECEDYMAGVRRRFRKGKGKSAAFEVDGKAKKSLYFTI